jgi:hypothetical protein
MLVSLTFDADPLIAWRAVDALGRAAGRVADSDPEFVRSHLRRLHWFMSDESGAICWFAPQAMAAIVRARPELFSDYADIVFSLILTTEEEDLAHFRSGILWAIGTLAPIAPEKIDAVIPAVVACLDMEDSQVRGTAVWCLKQAGRADFLAGRDDLGCDERPVEFYSNQRIERTTVAALVVS